MARTDVVDAGAGEIPVTHAILLAQSEDMKFLVHRQPTDQCDQRRDHPILARTVDTPGHY
jgi:hypothetical protein